MVVAYTVTLYPLVESYKAVVSPAIPDQSIAMGLSLIFSLSTIFDIYTALPGAMEIPDPP